MDTRFSVISRAIWAAFGLQWSLGITFWPAGFNTACVTVIHSQAMEDHRVRQARIVEALEAEKRKISKELEEMQKKRALRENHTPPNGEFPSRY